MEQTTLPLNGNHADRCSLLFLKHIKWLSKRIQQANEDFDPIAAFNLTNKQDGDHRDVAGRFLAVY